MIIDSRNSECLSKIKRASSSITLLNYSGYQFENLDLNQIKIPYADLSFSNFKNVNLKSSDCSHCFFDKSTLHNVDFSKSKLLNCSFGSFDVLNAKLKVTLCTINHD